MATVDELDAWGHADALDSLGSLDSLDNLVLHSASGSGAFALTASANSIKYVGVSGSTTIVITGVSTANFLVNISGAGSIALTQSSAIALTHAINGSASFSLSANDVALNKIQSVSGESEISVNGSANTIVILTFTGTGLLAITASSDVEILGDQWTDQTIGTETWSTITESTVEWGYQ